MILGAREGLVLTVREERIQKFVDTGENEGSKKSWFLRDRFLFEKGPCPNLDFFDADRAEIWGTSTVWRVVEYGIFIFFAGDDVCGKTGFEKF